MRLHDRIVLELIVMVVCSAVIGGLIGWILRGAW